MNKAGTIMAILLVGGIMLPIFKDVLDFLFDEVVTPLPGLTNLESFILSTYPIAIALAVIVAVIMVIRSGPRRR